MVPDDAQLANFATDIAMAEREKQASEALFRAMLVEQQKQINRLTLQNAQLARRLGELDAENAQLREQAEYERSSRVLAVNQASAAEQARQRAPEVEDRRPALFRIDAAVEKPRRNASELLRVAGLPPPPS